MIFAVNLLIMLGWAAAAGRFSSGVLAGGFAVGFAALWLARDLFGPNRYHARAFAAVALLLRFLKELFVSSVQVAAVVLNPFARPVGAFLTVPLDAETDVEILLTANLISLTPGTLTVDVAEDRRSLIVHAMSADDPAAATAGIKAALERPALEALR
jgi:multicomponent Na+:H+ antiporter subunit E